MSSKFENGLFIFRRDLRIIDNNGLNALNSVCKNIFTIFIFTPEQVSNSNKYKSDNSVQFMIESLEDLSSVITKNGGKLYTFYGNNENMIAECIRVFNIDIVCFNIDYTPYAIQRDKDIIKLCEKMKTYVMYEHDYYLHEPGTILNGTNEPYKKFTPYYNSALKKKVESPLRFKNINFSKKQTSITNSISLKQAILKFTKENPNILIHGGRQNAIKQLSTALRTQKHYSTTHNELWKPTSELSAYIKFGCLSIREIYNVFKKNHDFVRQLIWRDFYANILFSFPYVLGHSMKTNYSKIKWHHNSSWFEAWCNGNTGFPIVDAGMRQLNTTGYMHNRARLIVSSFLVKTLLIDWREGEKYFAKKLVDYDPASNNGNWQWVASTGADSQPFFRIFNPTEQGKNFDPDCLYIKKWIPQLDQAEPSIIHNWETEWRENKQFKYPKPICDYKIQKEKALKMYKNVFIPLDI
jgi:deoxyribodipyrimidine photo-lyase